MILFDTNELLSLTMTGSVAAILQSIAAEAGLKLAISSVTEDEFRSERSRELQKAIDSAQRSHSALQRIAPYWKPPEFSYPSLDSLVEREMDRVRSVFTVLPLDGAHAVEALRREAERRRPASTDLTRPGTGARDTAIWLTAIEHSRKSGKPVYLVSADGKAFGKEVLDPVLITEATSKSAEIILYPSVAKLIDRFARRIEVTADIPELLASDSLTHSIREAMAASTFIEASIAVPGEGVFSSAGIEALTLLKTFDIHGYEVQGERWIAARSNWSGRRLMTRHAAENSITEDWEVTFEQRLTLLIRLSGEEVQSANVISAAAPRILNARKISVTMNLGVATETDTAMQLEFSRDDRL